MNDTSYTLQEAGKVFFKSWLWAKHAADKGLLDYVYIKGPTKTHKRISANSINRLKRKLINIGCMALPARRQQIKENKTKGE